MNGIELKIRLLAPVLLTGVGNGEENSAVTLNYISGGVLRGICIHSYLRENEEKGADLVADPEARTLFWSDQVDFLNGYISSDGKTRAMPFPLSWHIAKGELDNPKDIHDFSLMNDVEIKDVDNPRNKKDSFMILSEDTVSPNIPIERWQTVHNASNNPMSKGDDSTVFRYDALAKGQTFIAYIISNDKSLLSKISGLLSKSKRYYLGRSRRAGYGEVEITVGEIKRFNEYSDEELEPDDVTTITLLSDALLSDKLGQPTTDFNLWLAYHLKKPELKAKKVFAQTGIVGGFDRKWGVPIPQRYALKKGSSFVFSDEDITAEELKELVEAGVGDRRNEGFGRIAVNLNDSATLRAKSIYGKSKNSESLDESSKRIAEQMAFRLAEDKIQTAVWQHVNKISFDGGRVPKNAQLSQMRLALRDTQSNNVNGILDRLDQLKADRKRQFEKKRIDGTSWNDWLTERAKMDALDLLNIDLNNIRVANQPVASSEESKLKLKATVSLIDAVIHKAMKESNNGD